MWVVRARGARVLGVVCVAGVLLTRRSCPSCTPTPTNTPNTHTRIIIITVIIITHPPTHPPTHHHTRTPHHTTIKKANKPVIGIVQDTLLGARLMTSRDCFIEKDVMFNVLLNLEVCGVVWGGVRGVVCVCVVAVP